MIKSVASTNAAAVFAGHAVRGLPSQIQQRARAKLVAIDAAGCLDDLRGPVTGWKFFAGTGLGNMAFASMRNGAFVSPGVMAMPGTSRLLTIIRSHIEHAH